MERKLSTILALDVVDFSKLMASDEDIALSNLRQRREIIDEAIHSLGGRIFGSAGDSVIAEFASPVRAVEAAVNIQAKMQAINENLPEHQRMKFRVGVNIGDVMVSESNLYGDSVNIAARLEAAAKPEGVCIAKSVFDLVSQKLKLSFEPLGELTLKNIDRPIEAYSVAATKNPGRYVQNFGEPLLKAEKAKPDSLAVMLFKSLSSDEEQAYFCEGFSEDLISTLSKFKQLQVASCSASFAYRERTKTPKQMGLELGIRYLVEGSVRKLGPKMRITASLINCDRENTIWSNNFDTSLEEIFDIQDEIIETIVSTIVGRVEADVIQQSKTVRPDNLAAYDLVLQGLDYHRRSGITKDNAEKAFNLFEQAIELDPNYARAHAWRACSLSNYRSWAPEKFGGDWLSECLYSVTKALEFDPNDAEAHRIMGAIKLQEKDFDAAHFHHNKARELCPSDSYISAKCATALIFLGEPEEALKEIRRAEKINPFCSDELFEDEGIIHFCLGSYDKAVESFKKLKLPTINSLFYLAATYEKKEMFKEAEKILAQAQSHSGLSVSDFVATQKYRDLSRIQDLEVSLMSI